MKEYTIYNCDYKEAIKDIKMRNIKVDMIFTDPPYKITSRGKSKRDTSGGMFKKDLSYNGKLFDNNDIKIEEWIEDMYDILKEGGHCYIMTNHKNLPYYLKVIENTKFKYMKCLIWDKGNKIMGTYYMNSFEYIIFLRKGKAVRINNCGTSDILRIKNNKLKKEDGSNYHDTEKPYQLSEILVLNSSKEGELIFDPFMGIGGCGVASLKNNRSFLGIEIFKDYYDFADERMKEFI